MSKSYHSKILALGSAFPDKVLANSDLEKIVDTSDEWIRQRTGISQRRQLSPGEQNSDLGARAAKAAIAKAKLDPMDIDLIIYCTCSPDKLLPATACITQAKIGAMRAVAFDIEAACAGWLIGVSIADQYVKSGAAKNVLVIGAEALTRFVNFQDRNTCVLFGDAAGAAIISRAQDGEPSRIHPTAMISDGNFESILDIKAGGSAVPVSPEAIARGDSFIAMNGKEVFKFAVRALVERANEAMDKAGITAKDIKWLVPHQANIRIIEAISDKLGFPMDRTLVNLHKYGNTSSATMPTALDEAVDDGRVQRGDILLFATFGGGLTSAATVVQW